MTTRPYRHSAHLTAHPPPERLTVVITDRDIVVKVLARGKDPGSTTAGESAPGKPVTIGADHGIDQLDRTMPSTR